MSTITKEFNYHRSEDYGGGNILATATYQSCADYINISVTREKDGIIVQDTFGLPLEEWKYMFDLINESLEPKGQSI